MSPSDPDPAALKRRQRYVAEAILDNSALRNALDDPQAQRLIDWGLTRLDKFVARTQTMSDDEATPLMEEAVTAVSRVMRQVNELVEHPTDPLEPSEAQLRNPLGALSKQMVLWQSLALPTADTLQTIAQQEAEAQHTPEELFDSLMAVLDTAEPKANPTAEAPIPEPEVQEEPPKPEPQRESFWRRLFGRS